MSKIAFIGIGNMGRNMCGNIVKTDQVDVAVHDAFPNQMEGLLALDNVKNAKKKPVWADTPADCAKDADIIFLSLNGPKDTKQVMFGKAEEGSFAGADKTKPGVLQGVKKGAIVCDMSTNNPKVSEELEKACKAAGVGFCDTPVSGGVGGARAGTLSIMCGGETADFEKAKPILGMMGKNIFHCGKAGTGGIAKLVNNQLAFTSMMALTEGLVLGSKAGIDPNVLREVVAASSGNTMVWGPGGQQILRDRVDRVGFTVDLACKDIGLTQELATEVGVNTPLGAFVRGLLLGHQANGFGPQDVFATVKHHEEASGFKVRGMWKEEEKKSKL